MSRKPPSVLVMSHFMDASLARAGGLGGIYLFPWDETDSWERYRLMPDGTEYIAGHLVDTPWPNYGPEY